MPYNKLNNILFIHIPKTAGTSVIKMFDMNDKEGHVPYIKYKNINEDLFNRSFKFAIVRNPWDKFVSCYEYAKMDKSYWHSKDGNAIYGKHEDYDLVNKYKFNDFIMYLKNNFNGKKLPLKSINWSYQYIFVCDNNSKVNVDILYRYEELDFMINELNSKFKSDYKLPTLNKSKNKDFRTYYNDESIEFIYSLYKKDIELFNYNFD